MRNRKRRRCRRDTRSYPWKKNPVFPLFYIGTFSHKSVNVVLLCVDLPDYFS